MPRNVIFKFGTKAQYNALAVKDPNTLYWLYDVQELYKGNVLYGVGRDATVMASGLMSAADKQKLDALAETQIADLVPIDGSIAVVDGENGVKSIGLRVSAKEGNALVLEDDGMFVPVPSETVFPEFTIEKAESAEDGYAASYRLKRTLGDSISYVGDVINVPKDLVVQSGTVETVVVEGYPYDGAKVGDMYIDLVLSDENSSHIYIPANGLVDAYLAGNGIQIVGNEVSIKLDENNSNGLSVSAEGLGLALATHESAGAMSAVDKATLDSIPEIYATKDEVRELAEAVGTPNADQFSVKDGVLTIDELSADVVLYNGKKLSDILDNVIDAYTWEELPTPVDISSSDKGFTDAVNAAEDGAVINVSEGSVATPVTIASSVTINGFNAGIAQNFDQEV